jgi:hypothetical protein
MILAHAGLENPHSPGCCITGTLENVPRHWCNTGMAHRCAVISCLSAMLAAGSPATVGVSHAQTAAAVSARAGGIWKAAVPPKPMQGEFENLDPIGVAAGARIKADCSLNWINPDDRKLYCFSSGTSLEIFLDSPHANLARARRAWEKLSAPRR